jgi:hypothetical protein
VQKIELRSVKVPWPFLTYDLSGQAQRHAGAHHDGQRANQGPFDGRQIVERPLRRVLAGTRGDQRVRLAFLAQKTEHRRKRGETDPAVAHPDWIQPVLVEFEPRWHEV